MVKLSLLGLLNNQAMCMDEWELEIPSKKWAYDIILLSKKPDVHR